MQRSIQVGPNPACLVVAKNYLYASISDGYNYANGYANGKKVAKIDLKTFTKTKDIAVGMNPRPYGRGQCWQRVRSM